MMVSADLKFLYSRPKTNAVILLDMDHTLREEQTWEKYRKERKSKTFLWR
jgi:hypothetical protein